MSIIINNDYYFHKLGFRTTHQKGLYVIISLLSTTSPLLRDLTTLTLSDLSSILTCDFNDDSIRLALYENRELTITRNIPLAHPCLSCSFNEAIIPFLAEIAKTTPRLTIALPVAVDPMGAAIHLNEVCDSGELLDGSLVSTCIHAVNANTARTDLLSHIPLSDQGLALFDDDTRCTGEVLMMSLGYADLIVTIGEDPIGMDLIKHLHPHNTPHVTHLEDLTTDLVFSKVHNPDEALRRVHPAHTSAWGGPTEHGVWTVDLHSDKPFHPQRLAQFSADLAAHSTCARGCFWLPSRPNTICTWESNGGTASVGTAGPWKESARTHLIVTGLHDSIHLQEAITQTFSRILMTDEEMRDAFAWIGTDDGLDHWFPVE